MCTGDLKQVLSRHVWRYTILDEGHKVRIHFVTCTRPITPNGFRPKGVQHARVFRSAVHLALMSHVSLTAACSFKVFCYWLLVTNVV
jgi:hypothetical protein